MSRISRVASIAVAITVASIASSALVVGLGTTAAVADTSPVVLVSTDGVSYQPALTVGLFADAGLLVPGDTATSDLWIKNPTTIPATVRVSVGQIATSSNELGNNMMLTAVNTVDNATITATFSELAQCDIMVQPITIAAGAVLHVDLSLAMLNAHGLVAQHQDGWLTANIEMRDATAGAFPQSACDPGTGGTDTTPPATTEPAATHPRKVLGYTGENFPTGLLMLGGLLVGIGWFLVVARRRRKQEETQP